MMNEINPLIWPSPAGIGVLDPLWGQTVQIAKQAGIIKTDPSTSAYDTRSSPRPSRASPTTPRAPTSRRAPSR